MSLEARSGGSTDGLRVRSRSQRVEPEHLPDRDELASARVRSVAGLDAETSECYTDVSALNRVVRGGSAMSDLADAAVRFWKRIAVGGILVLVLFAVAAVLFSLSASSANSANGNLRSQLRDTESRAASAESEVGDLHALITDREKRFKLMGFACARLINEYDLYFERLQYEAGRVAFGEESVASLKDYLYGEGHMWANNAYFEGQDRIGCGMKLAHPNKFPEDEVEVVAKDWHDGVELPQL